MHSASCNVRLSLASCLDAKVWVYNAGEGKNINRMLFFLDLLSIFVLFQANKMFGTVVVGIGIAGSVRLRDMLNPMPSSPSEHLKLVGFVSRLDISVVCFNEHGVEIIFAPHVLSPF